MIGNSLKYKKEECFTEIKVTCQEYDFKWVISIEDNGIGIDSEYFDIIFKPFVRLHNQSQFPGSGLGLSTCKKIVECLNGDIKVSSVKNEGSKFIIELPKS